MSERERLERTLQMARRVLAILEEQVAGYRSLSVPPELLISLEDKRREVARLEAGLQAVPPSSPAVAGSGKVSNPASAENIPDASISPEEEANELKLEKIQSDKAILGNYGDAADAEQAARLGLSVCLVEAPGYGGEIGTGFLVAPQLVLTNYHVLSAVGAIGDLAKKATKLAFRFGYRGSGTSVRLGRLIKADPKQPLLASSEIQKLDYALLQLEQTACDENGNLIPPLTIVYDRQLRSKEPVWIVQHPQGSTLRFAQGEISRVDPAGQRFEYTTNTEPGSSGSPVFDRYWNLVGLHHSGAPIPKTPEVGKDNEGIPFSAIWPEIQPLLEEHTNSTQTQLQTPPHSSSNQAGATPQTGPANKLRLFLCHSGSALDKVQRLYERLKGDGYQPWLAEEDLLPGQDWKREIPRAVKRSEAVLICLSKDFAGKAGHFQKETRLALDTAQEQPEGTIFVIPVRLEESDIPESLQDLTSVNLFEANGYSRLLKALGAQ
jgi:hypothetical protein